MTTRILAVVFLLCSALGWAQMGSFNYGSNKYTTDGDNTSNQYTQPGTWHLTVNSPSLFLAGITVALNPSVPDAPGTGAPATIYAWDSSGNVYQYNDFNSGSLANTWQTVSGMGTVDQMAVGGSGLIYSLKAGACDQYGNKFIRQWVNNAWVTRNGCALKLAVASTGRIAVINSSAAFYSDNNGASWTTVPASPHGGTYQGLDVSAKGVFLLDGLYYPYWLNGNTLVALGGANSGSQITADDLGNVYVLGGTINPNGPHVYRRLSGGTWKILADVSGGTWAFLTSRGPAHTFAILDTGSRNRYYQFVYRQSPIKVTATGQLYGNGTCGGSCTGLTHFDNLQFQFTTPSGHHAGNNATTHSGPYSDYVNLQSVDTQFDTWDCFESWGCPAVQQANVDCSATGNHDEGSGTIAPIPCEIPSTGLTQWPPNSVVYVYVDSHYFNSCANLNCPGTTTGNLVAGFQEWAHTTLQNVSFAWGGSITNTTTFTTANGFVFVAPVTNPSQSAWVFVSYSSSGCNSLVQLGGCEVMGRGNPVVNQWLTFRGDPRTKSANELTWAGAHETGHALGLNDCYAAELCTATETETIMWPIYDAGVSLLGPSACDELSANQAFTILP